MTASNLKARSRPSAFTTQTNYQLSSVYGAHVWKTRTQSRKQCRSFLGGCVYTTPFVFLSVSLLSCREAGSGVLPLSEPERFIRLFKAFSRGPRSAYTWALEKSATSSLYDVFVEAPSDACSVLSPQPFLSFPSCAFFLCSLLRLDFVVSRDVWWTFSAVHRRVVGSPSLEEVKGWEARQGSVLVFVLLCFLCVLCSYAAVHAEAVLGRDRWLLAIWFADFGGLFLGHRGLRVPFSSFAASGVFGRLRRRDQFAMRRPSGAGWQKSEQAAAEMRRRE